MRVVIVGAGGHGQVVADVLLCAAKAGSGTQPVGYVDDDGRPQTMGRIVNGLIVESWNTFDFLTMYQQIGVPLALPAAS